MHVQNLKFVALPVFEIIGVFLKTGQSLDTPTLPFLPNFSGLLFGWTMVMYWPILKSVIPVPEIIANKVLDWGCEPQSWGRTVPFERALVSSYRPSIITFPVSLRVLEILPLLCSIAPLFPTPPLVSQKFPPWSPGTIGGWPLGYTKSEGVRLIVRAISFQDFQPTWSWSTNVTDRQTDKQTDLRHTIEIPRFALK